MQAEANARGRGVTGAPPRPPSVSVVIPAYNAAAHIGEALASVFAQTYADFEVIVVNDGSPDTPELERALAPYAGSILYLEQPNLGPSAARNAGVARARGEYVAFLDGDDAWEPEYLAEQMKALGADPSLDLIYADALLFGEGVPAGLTFMRAAPSRGAATFESLLRSECSVITSCVVARKGSLVRAGLFDPRFFRSEDFDLWVRLAHAGGRVGYQRRVLARHRAHPASLSADPTRMFASKIEICRKLMRELPLSAERRLMVEREIARCEADIAFTEGKRAFRAGRFEEAARSLAEANRHYRSRKLGLVLVGLRVAPRLLKWVDNLRRAARAPARKA